MQFIRLYLYKRDQHGKQHYLNCSNGYLVIYGLTLNHFQAVKFPTWVGNPSGDVEYCS
jgi:hypothetical protein